MLAELKPDYEVHDPSPGAPISHTETAHAGCRKARGKPRLLLVWREGPSQFDQ